MNVAPTISREVVASRIQHLATLGLALVLVGCAGPHADKKPTPATTTVAKPGARQTIRVQAWFIEIKTDTPDAQALVDELEQKTGMKKIGGDTGLLTTSEAKAIWDKLQTSRRMDILGSPAVFVASGNQASISIGQQMRYPARWELDAEKNTWTPMDFEARQIGVETQVAPELRDDGRIDLEFRATATEFDGFVRTDKPTSPSPAAPTDVVTLEGKLLKTEGPVAPVFSVRNVKTQISLRPGETLVLQGPVRQTVPAVLGQVPDDDADARAPRASFIFVTAGEDMRSGWRAAP